MHELKACWPIVQQISVAGTRVWKKRKAVSRSSDDERTRARPRSEAFANAEDVWAEMGVFTG